MNKYAESHVIQTISARITESEPRIVLLNEREPRDGALEEVVFDVFGKEIPMQIVFRKEIRASMVGELQRRKESAPALLVLAEYVPPSTRTLLRSSGINYADMQGHTFLRLDNAFFMTDDPAHHAENLPETDETKTLFTPARMKASLALWQFANKEGHVSGTQRAWASWANVSLGAINETIEVLKKLHVIAENGFFKNGNLVFVDKISFVEKWVTGYEQVLRQKIHRGSFQLPKNVSPTGFLKDFNPVEVDGFWGGESAAARASNDLIPGKHCLFSNAEQSILVSRFKWIPVKTGGNLVLFNRFWNPDLNQVDSDSVPVAPELLCFAELVASHDGRLIKLAEQLWKPSN